MVDRIGKGASSQNLQKYSVGDGGQHSFGEEEKIAFVDWINECLGKDEDLKALMLISPNGDDLFRKVNNGILLCKLVNDAVPGTIDVRAINKDKDGKMVIFKKTENQNLAINSAKSIGCSTVNIGAQDMIDGTPHLVLGLIWQIVKIGLFSHINIKNHPELYRLLEPGEKIEDLLKLPVEQILVRWVNYHLKNAGSQKRVKNFGNDIKDSEAYTVLLKQIAPKSMNIGTQALNESDYTKRAVMVLDNAEKMKAKKFLRPPNIVQGHAKLNLAFVANLFNMYPALEPVEEKVVIVDDETREEKTFRNWMNSQGVDPFVNRLYDDLTDGLVLLQLFDKIQPGIVDWKRVNKPPWPKMGANLKHVENLNYCMELGKQLKFSLVGVQGKDIYDKNKTLTLGLVWQMMRAYLISILTKLSKTGKPIGDKEILEWANNKLQSAHKQSKVSSFKDPAISDSRPIADLVDAISPGSIDYSLLSTNDADKQKNANYVISVGRKIGAVIYCLDLDIVEVQPKMVLACFAALMAVDLGVEKKQ